MGMKASTHTGGTVAYYYKAERGEMKKSHNTVELPKIFGDCEDTFRETPSRAAELASVSVNHPIRTRLTSRYMGYGAVPIYE